MLVLQPWMFTAARPPFVNTLAWRPEQGTQVLVLEKAADAGGTSAMAGGHFYLGGGTAVQQATGHDDTPEEMYKYLVAVTPDPDHEKIRAYCEGSVEHFNWLESLGFQFERSFWPGKVVVPLQDVTLANGSGMSSTTIPVPVATVMNGKHIVAYHEKSGSEPGGPVVCGAIPAQTATASM